MSEKAIVYSFENFRVDTANKVLLNKDSEISLTPKVYDTLIVFIENPGRLLEKEELMQKIWKDSFVEEGNLAFNIKMLRKALKDDANNPKFIQTVPRRGYRFIANVSGEHKTAPTTQTQIITQLDEQDSSGLLKSKYQKYLLAALGFFLLLIILGFTIFYRSPRFDSTSGFQQINVSQLTSNGNTFFAIISPDGKYIIHAIEDKGKQSLWIRQSEENKDIEIVEPTEGRIGGITVSPDSKSVFYTLWQENEPDAILYQAPILGGLSKKIISNIDSGISFSSDGNEFVFFRTNKNQGLSQLILANSDGSHQRLITEKHSPETFETEFGDPIWKPNERKILAISTSNLGNAKSDVVEIEIETGLVKPFVEAQWRDIRQIAWLKKDKALLFTALDDETQTNQIWLIDSKSGKFRQITNDLKNYRGLSLTTDEKTLVSTQIQQITKLWKTTDKTASQADEILSETGSIGENEGLALTKADELIFSIGEFQTDNISILDKSGIRPLTFDTKGNRQPTVCGDYIVYSANFVSIEPNELRLWRIDKDGKNPQQLITEETESEMYPHCSINGNWVVFQKGWEKTSIWKVSIEGGVPIQLTTKLSFQPVISPDGKMVAYFFRDNFKWGIEIISLDDGKLVKEISLNSKGIIKYLRWTPDGKNLAYSDTQKGYSNIWLQPIDGAKSSQLTQFDSEMIYYFDWSPDGKNLVYSRGKTSSDIVSITDVR